PGRRPRIRHRVRAGDHPDRRRAGSAGRGDPARFRGQPVSVRVACRPGASSSNWLPSYRCTGAAGRTDRRAGARRTERLVCEGAGAERLAYRIECSRAGGLQPADTGPDARCFACRIRRREEAMSERRMRLDHLLSVYRVGSGDWPWTEEYDNLIDRTYTQQLLTRIREEGIREPILLGTDGRVWDG